jgi:serine/threonine protein kinase
MDDDFELEDGLPNVDEAHTIHFEQLKFDDEIGSGSFGSVYKGTYLGTPVAIKKIAKSEDLQEELDIFVQREAAMAKYSHPHLVQFIGVSAHGPYVYLVTEYVPGGDLRRYLKNPDVEIGWKLRVQIAADVARAMAFLHSKKIMHRDLKSKNLLVDANWKIKLCDFGFARTYMKGKRPYTLCGTEDWMAPEIITGQDYDERVDLFSFGIVLCEFITRRKISRELQRKPEEAFALNPNELFKLIPRDCPEALKQLALKCADYTPENRPSFLKVLDSLAEIDKELREGTLQTSGGIKLAPEPSTPKPEIWAPAVSKRLNIRSDKRDASATIEKTKLALAPKTKFAAIARRSIEQKRDELAKSHDVSQMHNLTFSDSEAFYDALYAFSSNTDPGWILLGYSADRTLCLQGSGVTIEELVENLKDVEVQYVLFRVPIDAESYKQTHTTRDVFIMWSGPNMSAVQAGKKKSHVGEVKKILKPFHAELTAVNKDTFTLENVIAKSDPLSGSHVID